MKLTFTAGTSQKVSIKMTSVSIGSNAVSGTTVTLVKAPGSPSGTVRVRSGSYLSPAFHVTEAPQRVAIPYPAPYPYAPYRPACGYYPLPPCY
jgi:hypothetical protein